MWYSDTYFDNDTHDTNHTNELKLQDHITFTWYRLAFQPKIYIYNTNHVMRDSHFTILRGQN